MPASIEYIKAGKLHGLAVTTATRTEALPDIPTLGDFLPGFEASSWYGVGAPKNTPTEIIDKLNKEIKGHVQPIQCDRCHNGHRYRQEFVPCRWS
jgi:tripartite-type tricarboxylate transporter receptor subunit TctC